MSDPVWLKWIDGGLVVKACHVDVESAVGQAAQEARSFLGVFDGPEDHAQKLAEAKGANEVG